MSKNERLVDLDDSSFYDYIRNNEIILVDFWAPWCMPCRVQGRMLRSEMDKFPDQVKVAKINVDENGSVSTRYNVRGIPQMYLFVNGEPVKGWTGVTTVGRLIKEISPYL